MDERFLQGRHFLKANWHFVTDTKSDQSLGVPAPPQEIPPEADDSLVALPPVEGLFEDGPSLHALLLNRKSRRNFRVATISLEELTYLLWACEGVRENKGKFSFRTAPSGGARHPLDLYLFARNVEGLKPGLYRYLPVEHLLVLEREGDDLEALDKALMGQLANASCVLFWAAVPYRSEWRYGKAADKLVALDAGHSCQNLYLACETLGFGTCAIGKYDQDLLDKYLGLDGEDMFAIYAAIVGKPADKE